MTLGKNEKKARNEIMGIQANDEKDERQVRNEMTENPHTNSQSKNDIQELSKSGLLHSKGKMGKTERMAVMVVHEINDREVYELFDLVVRMERVPMK